MVDRKPFNIDVIGDVELKGGNYIYVSFYDSYSINNIGLKIKSKLPKIVSYTYNGVKYNPSEFGFSYFKPEATNSISVKGSTPYFKESNKFNPDKIFFPTGHLYIYFNNGLEKSELTLKNAHEEIMNSNFSGIDFSDNIQLNYKGIEKIIKNRLSDLTRPIKIPEEGEKSSKKIDNVEKSQLFFESPNVSNNSKKYENTDFWDKPQRLKDESTDFWEEKNNNVQEDLNLELINENQIERLKNIHWDSISKTTGYFIDKRDGQQYKTITFSYGKSSVTWMAENLKYSAIEKYVYQNNQKYKNDFGWLYPIEVLSSLCPIGWKLPSKEHWEMFTVNDKSNEIYSPDFFNGIGDYYQISNNNTLNIKGGGYKFLGSWVNAKPYHNLYESTKFWGDKNEKGNYTSIELTPKPGINRGKKVADRKLTDYKKYNIANYCRCIKIK